MASPISEVPWLDRRCNRWFYAYWYDASVRRTRYVALGTQDAGQAKEMFGHFLLTAPAHLKLAIGDD